MSVWTSTRSCTNCRYCHNPKTGGASICVDQTTQDGLRPFIENTDEWLCSHWTTDFQPLCELAAVDDHHIPV